MRYIAGIDIGNSSTEVALATLNASGEMSFVSSALAETTGIKGTLRNVHGIQEALAQATRKVGINVSDISLIRINEATPVIGDVAMETITETIITESTMIGHNPKTPGGVGLGVGLTITPQELLTRPADTPYILVVSSAFDFADIATMINASVRAGYQLTGVILQRDDGVLVSNRLEIPLPIVDEVLYIDRIPLGMLAAIEVAVPGKVIETLSNPYGIATVFALNAEETKNIVPVARALIGNRSAVVVKTPSGDVKARSIPAGNIELLSAGRTIRVDVAAGAEDLGPEPEALHHRLLLILGKLPGRISRVCIVGVLLIALALIVEVEFKKGPARIVVGVAGFERLSRCRAQQRGRSAGDKRRTPCGSMRRLLLNVVFDVVAIFDTEHDHQR